MKIIAHRGNVVGPMESWENEPTYIDLAIKKGYDVEIDIWAMPAKYGTQLFLGHDEPMYGIDMNFIQMRITSLWIHCKNIEAFLYLKNHEDVGQYTNYFWHENDKIALTSLGYIWAYPGNQSIKDSIAVMPEINDDDVSQCLGICTDYAEKYAEKWK